MRQKIIGFELEKVDRERLVSIKMPKEMKEYFKIGQKPDWQKFLEYCLASEKNYQKAEKAVKKAMKEALPENVSEGCKYCKEDSDNELDKNCSHYYSQMNISYLFAVDAFCNIINQNPHIKSSRKILQELTVKFYNCLKFVKGQGIMYFDLDEISRHCLYAGFLSLSRTFSNSPPLQNLSTINNTLNDLESKEVENELYEKEDENYISIQKKFFQKEQRYYKEKIYLSEKSLPNKEAPKNLKSGGASIPQYALYYIYLQESGDFGYFENHPNGKLKAIEELIEKEGINTTTKYFQKVYNNLTHYKTNRVAKKQVANIYFVANTMLKDLPKAQKIALAELKDAKTKHK